MSDPCQGGYVDAPGTCDLPGQANAGAYSGVN